MNAEEAIATIEPARNASASARQRVFGLRSSLTSRKSAFEARPDHQRIEWECGEILRVFAETLATPDAQKRCEAAVESLNQSGIRINELLSSALRHLREGPLSEAEQGDLRLIIADIHSMLARIRAAEQDIRR